MCARIRPSRYWWAGIGLLGLAASLTGCGSADPVPLQVYCAGSLMVPFKDMETAFEKAHPGVDVLIEGHGSIQAIRQVTELHKAGDVVAVADHYLLPLLMYSSTMPDSDTPYADWNIAFATNTLGLAYSEDSRYADEINEQNWHEILSRPDVKVGMADPRIDACGYRALMACQLAADLYGQPELLKTITGDFDIPLSISQAEGVTTITVPPVVEPATKRLLLRSDSVWLIPLVQSGDVDYAFEYESVARQHGVRFMKLPDAVNLSAADYADTYRTVRVELAYQRFTSITPVFPGEPIIYGITIPRNAPHPDLARDFIAFILSAEGQAILEQDYQPAITPAAADYPGNLPAGL